jgi:hypothetical protein
MGDEGRGILRERMSLASTVSLGVSSLIGRIVGLASPARGSVGSSTVADVLVCCSLLL